MYGLPGGSPGPNAEGNWITFLIVFAAGLALAGGIYYCFVIVDEMLKK